MSISLCNLLLVWFWVIHRNMPVFTPPGHELDKSTTGQRVHFEHLEPGDKRCLSRAAEREAAEQISMSVSYAYNSFDSANSQRRQTTDL